MTTSSNFRQLLEAEIDVQLGNNFSVLGDHPSAKKIILGVISVESGTGMSWRNVSIPHQLLPATAGFGKAYENHPIIKAARQNPSIDPTNLNDGRTAHSLLGCMGAYLIRGLETGRGFPYVQVPYRSVAESVGLLVNPGESIKALFTEDIEGLRRGLVAGMCILEYNYKNALKTRDKDAAIQRAVRLHLGDPNAADAVTGISNNDYLARVMNNANKASSPDPGAKYGERAVNIVRNAPVKSGVTHKRNAPGCGTTV